MKKEAIQKRNSSIELLRILLMLMIILSHYSVHGNFMIQNLPFSFNKILLYLSVLGNLGVDIFVLISGYYLSNKNFKISKLLKLLFEITSYSLIIYLIFMILGKVPFSLTLLKKAMLPTIYNEYWFATTYVILYLLSPFINKLINALNRKEYSNLLLITSIIWIAIPSILNETMYTSPVIQFLLLYLIGGYLRKYPNCYLLKKTKITTLLTITSTSIIIIKIIINCHKEIIDYTFLQRDSIFIIIIALGIFIFFLNKKFYNKIINKISSCVFGIYLFHDHDYIRNFLWLDLFKNAQYKNSQFLIIHLLISVILVFILGSIIEIIRKKLLQKAFDKSIDKYMKTSE